MQPPSTLAQMTKKRSVSTGRPGPTTVLPPAGLAGERMRLGDVLVAGQRMADQHGVGLGRRSARRRCGRRRSAGRGATPQSSASPSVERDVAGGDARGSASVRRSMCSIGISAQAAPATRHALRAGVGSRGAFGYPCPRFARRQPDASCPRANRPADDAPAEPARLRRSSGCARELDRHRRRAARPAPMQRAEVVARRRALRPSAGVALRPGREAEIIRRLLARHQGALPPAAHACGIWRELFAATTAMQGRFASRSAEPDRPSGYGRPARASISARRRRCASMRSAGPGHRRAQRRGRAASPCCRCRPRTSRRRRLVDRAAAPRRAARPRGRAPALLGAAAPRAPRRPRPWCSRPPRPIAAGHDRSLLGLELPPDEPRPASPPRSPRPALSPSAPSCVGATRRRGRAPRARRGRRLRRPRTIRACHAWRAALRRPARCSAPTPFRRRRSTHERGPAPAPRSPGHRRPMSAANRSSPGVNRIIKLSSNEGAFGPPPGARRRPITPRAAELHRYPGRRATALRQAIGARFGLDPGAHRLRRRLGRSASTCSPSPMAGRATRCSCRAHGFSMYEIAAPYAGARGAEGAGDAT